MIGRLIKKIKRWWNSDLLFIVADPQDNSITISKMLFDSMKSRASDGELARVFVFYIRNEERYGFMVNPDIEDETQMCDIQYSEAHQTVGFETLCPTVNKILYDYGIGVDGSVKLSITEHETNNKVFYRIEKPK